MATADTLTKVTFEKVTPAIGARVHGVPLDQEANPAILETLRRGLHAHGVLFFEFGKCVEDTEFQHFARLFGEVESGYRFTTKQTSDQPKVPCIDAKFQPLTKYRINEWHSDGTPFECPPQAAILTPIDPPDVGGGTMWSSMYAAYDDLSSHFQRLLDGLTVLHSTIRTPFIQPAAQTTHPAVIRDPVTGKKALFVNSNYAERFLDMSQRESDALLHFLFEHVNTPEFHVGVTWRLGTVAVWEERITQHRGIDSFIGERRLRRLTFKGDKPTA
jgi:taurine dioxygenase